jgi:cysteine desulfurase
MPTNPIYMDYHATTPVDPHVLEAMMPFFTEHFGNAASLQHRFGWIAKEAVEIARKNIAHSINAQPGEIVFTSGATESNNLAIKGIAEANRGKGNHIITTQIEHKCILESCKEIEQHGFEATYLTVDSTGEINIDDLRKSISPKTILVSVMSANNEIGTIQPIEEIGKLCSDAGVIFHTDATQYLGKYPIDVQKMNIHSMSFSSHKMYGPKGIGALYIRSRSPRISIRAQMSGGGHERGIRSGTLNVASIVGFGKAVTVAVESMKSETARLRHQRDRLQEKLSLLENISINGNKENRLANNLSVQFHDVNAEMLQTELSDIALSAGAACHTENGNEDRYSHVLKAIGLDEESAKTTLRFGIGRYTTDEEITIVAERVSRAVEKLRTYSLEGVQ